jgi:hypothetical protein
MQTLNTTVIRVNEPSSAPPEFFWEDVSGIHQQNLSAVTRSTAFGNRFWGDQNPDAATLGVQTPLQGYWESGVPSALMTSSEPPVFFAEGSNLDPQYAIRSVFGPSAYQTILTGAETSVVKTGFPAEEWQLTQEYGELGETLKELAILEEEDDWRIEESVYAAASYYATELRSGSIPAPQVSVHGPKSVIFNWSNGYYNLYLTISANNVSALLSSPERIIRRKEFSKTALASPLALLYFGS